MEARYFWPKGAKSADPGREVKNPFRTKKTAWNRRSGGLDEPRIYLRKRFFPGEI